MMLNDEHFMREALAQATLGQGLTRPNPPVGAVVVKSGRVIGRGFHRKAGGPHAEVFALADAGKGARGATVYVTLEPCCTQGRTPPCTSALILAGVKRVVYGCVDPNPAHAGRADAVLDAAGIAVTSGVLRDACEAMIRPFAMRMLHQRPYVTLKLACSLDGRIADAHGTSKWITGPEARKAVQTLRRTADAVMVGAGTVRADDPSLLPRPAFGRKPYRVIIRGKRPLSTDATVFTDAAAERTLVFDGRRGLVRILRDLARQDIMHVVCEGGGRLAGSLLCAGLVDALWIFYAPKLIGGTGQPAVAGRGWSLAEAPRWPVESVEQMGEDVLVKFRRP